MIPNVDLARFRAAEGVVIDARSPSEFLQGRIPGSINLPLLNDEERVRVGTCYKQIGRHAAVELGYELVGPRFAHIIREARERLDGRPAKILCWRGGMRSNTLAWVLSSAGIDCIVLEGGYKTFRRHCLAMLQEPRELRVLGGFTGSGKTDRLLEMEREGEQVLDLEGLASHRGSSFGGIGLPEQPSNEQFENEIAVRWERFSERHLVWVEDESRRIGQCMVPSPLYERMQKAPFVLQESPMEERIARIRRDYDVGDRQKLVEATLRIEKRLGGLRTKEALQHLSEGDFEGWVRVLLEYYDRAYQRTMDRRETLV